MSVVNIKKEQLQKSGYQDFQDWSKNPNHIYIGRDMSFYVAGTTASKWHNPFHVKKYGLNICLEMYEKYIRSSVLYDQLDELRGKKLGCWCHPAKCHGDVLIKLLNDK
jgi:hypothetical protein